MNIKINILVFVLFILARTITAQENNSNKTISFIVPQYIITNGIRVDIDVRKPDSKSWWVISPYYYDDDSKHRILNPEDNSGFDPHRYESMYGVGLGIARKIFLRHGTKGFYAMAGVSYKYFNIRGDNEAYVEYREDDGLNYIEVQQLSYTVNINSYNGYATIGYQINPFSKFYIDFYLGFGLRYSTHESPQNVITKYNRGNIDYGYSGTHPVVGGRLGIAL